MMLHLRWYSEDLKLLFPKQAKLDICLIPSPSQGCQKPGVSKEQGRRGRRVPEPEPEMTEQQKLDLEALKATIAALEATMKDVKTSHDKWKKDLADVQIVKARLMEKGWGTGPIEFLATNTATIEKDVDRLFTKYATAKAHNLKEMTFENNDMLKEVRKTLKELYDATSTTWNSYKKNVLQDFIKMK